MKKQYYTWHDIEGACLEIARQIRCSDWTPDYIVGITRGGLIPANLLSQYLNIPMSTLNVSLRDHAVTESNCWMAEDALSINDPLERKNILIVDDINDTGATINWIKDDWQSVCYPDNIDWKDNIWHKSVRFAALTDNMSSDATVDFNNWEINKDEEDIWIVFPWEEFWKNKT